MADLERSAMKLLAGGALVALALSGPGCSPRPEPKAMPPQAVTSTTLEPPPPSEEPVAAPVPPRNDPVVIESGEQEVEPTTSEAVVEAARRRARAPANGAAAGDCARQQEPLEVLQGQLTVRVSRSWREVGGGRGAGPRGRARGVLAARSLETRQRWREASDAIPRLEGEAAELRTRFYATDDPYVRDGQIKPEWDRALDELAQAKRDVKTAEAEVAEVLEEGRQAGALPGWLREGIELEPEPPKPPKPANEPGEPVIIRDPPRDPSDPP